MQSRALILIAFFGFCFPHTVNAAALTLAWDAPGDGSATGYLIFYGTARGSYSQQINVGNTTSHIVNNLAVGTTYYFAVRAYDATGATSGPSNEISVTIAASAPPVVKALSLSSNVPPPQVLGTTVTWTAAASGGGAPYQYQWASYTAGKWTVSPWSTSSTWKWTPSTAATDYQVRVAVRSSGSTSTVGEMIQSVPFPVITPVISVTLQPNVAAPQTVGSTIRWSAVASAGASGYQYRWFLFNGTTWNATTGWTTGSTWLWVPSVPNDGYIVAVWVRTAGSSVDAPEAAASVQYSIKSSSIGSGACLGCQ